MFLGFVITSVFLELFFVLQVFFCTTVFFCFFILVLFPFELFLLPSSLYPEEEVFLLNFKEDFLNLVLAFLIVAVESS